MMMLQVLSLAVLLSDCTAARPRETPQTIHVTGSGVDLLNGAVIHSKVESATGSVQKSTEIVELTGDLKGKVLYQVTTTIDFAKQTLVNTGNQVFSGTVAGSEPVMIHDDQFRFDVNLATGEESGNIYLYDWISGPKVRCTLHLVGPGGVNADGNPIFDYAGDCTFRGN